MRKEDNIQALTHLTPEQAKPYNKLSDNQWNVYFYLLSVSDYNSLQREDHRYVYKSELSPSKIAKAFGFTPRTYYNIIEALRKKKLIIEETNYYLFPLPSVYATIPKKLLAQLLAYRKIVSIDLLRTYLLFKAVYKKYGTSKGLSTRNIVRCLGHSEGRTEFYQRVEICIDLLAKWKLISYKSEWREDPNIGKYMVYKITGVNEKSEELNFRGVEEYKLSGEGDFTKEEEEHIKKVLGNVFEDAAE